MSLMNKKESGIKSKTNLVNVVERISVGVGGIYGRDKYLLECGHSQWGSKGSNRVRCRKCASNSSVSQ